MFHVLAKLVVEGVRSMGRGSGRSVETALNDKLQVFTCKTQQDAGSQVSAPLQSNR